MPVYQKNIWLMIVCLVLTLFAGCGGGGDSNSRKSDDDPGETQASMEGEWHGTVEWETGVEWVVDLSLSQEIETTYSGSLKGSTSEGQNLPPVEDVSCTVNGSDVVVTAISRETESLAYELKFTGKLVETTLNGESAVHSTDNREGHGTFTMTKIDNDSPDDPDGPADHESVEVETGSCFTLSTGVAEPGFCPADGDIYFWAGGLNKADLSSDKDVFCIQEGTYTDLESVPVDYSACDWVNYVEGNLSPIDNTGYILRDVSLMHHYRMRVIKNGIGATTFEFEQID